MTFWPTLLRVFLCLALVLNGTASAMASTGMAIAHQSHGGMAMGGPAVDPAPAQDPECHEPEAAHAATEAQASSGDSPTGHASTSDCCQTSPCSCACVLVAPFFAPAMLPDGGEYTHVRSTRGLASGHTPPALPHLIRPPIA